MPPDALPPKCSIAREVGCQGSLSSHVLQSLPGENGAHSSKSAIVPWNGPLGSTLVMEMLVGFREEACIVLHQFQNRSPAMNGPNTGSLATLMPAGS